MVKVSTLRKAAYHRGRVNQAKALIAFVKRAEEDEGKIDYVKRRRRLALALWTLLGAGVGAKNGAVIAALNDRKPGKGALIGTGVGALAGLGLGAMRNRSNEYIGADPLLPSVVLAKS